MINIEVFYFLDNYDGRGPQSILEFENIKEYKNFCKYIELNKPIKIKYFLNIIVEMIKNGSYNVLAEIFQNGELFSEISSDKYEWWCNNGFIMFK